MKNNLQKKKNFFFVFFADHQFQTNSIYLSWEISWYFIDYKSFVVLDISSCFKILVSSFVIRCNTLIVVRYLFNLSSSHWHSSSEIEEKRWWRRRRENRLDLEGGTIHFGRKARFIYSSFVYWTIYPHSYDF